MIDLDSSKLGNIGGEAPQKAADSSDILEDAVETFRDNDGQEDQSSEAHDPAPPAGPQLDEDEDEIHDHEHGGQHCQHHGHDHGHYEDEDQQPGAEDEQDQVDEFEQQNPDADRLQEPDLDIEDQVSAEDVYAQGHRDQIPLEEGQVEEHDEPHQRPDEVIDTLEEPADASEAEIEEEHGYEVLPDVEEDVAEEWQEQKKSWAEDDE